MSIQINSTYKNFFKWNIPTLYYYQIIYYLTKIMFLHKNLKPLISYDVPFDISQTYQIQNAKCLKKIGELRMVNIFKFIK